MNKTWTNIIFITGLLLLANQTVAGPVQISGDDSIQTILAAQKGNQVTIKLDSGEELTGNVGEVTGKLVILQALSGKEFFDAVINMGAIAAVLVRSKE